MLSGYVPTFCFEIITLCQLLINYKQTTMRTSLLFSGLAIGLLACQAAVDPMATRDSMNGTYEVTRLTQYQHNRKTFDNYLPYLVADTVTIRHQIAISLGNASSPETDAFILRNLIQETSRLTRSLGHNLGGLRIRIKDTPTPNLYEFYRDGVTKIGQYERGTLSFDVVEPDSLNQPVRYIFQAKKISDKPNQF